MTTLQITLLGFALWTLGVLMFTIGVYRWSRVLTGKSAIHEFPADAPSGPGWYQRATRAHLNCIENLPVFTAIVVVAAVSGVKATALDVLGVVLLCARMAQTVTHVAFAETARTVGIRFSFFSVQLVAMVAMAVIVIGRALP
jgi:uncharacterized membrane protein YecN with MAPEG domain